MGKPRKSTRPPPLKRPDRPSRNSALDALRGLAIVLMVIDHVAGILLNVSIEYSTVRFWTRLSMPLFCVLMGYFLDPQKPNFRELPKWHRLGASSTLRRYCQIALATVAINVAYTPLYGEVEILGSLLVAYTLFLISGRFFPLFVLAVVLYPFDLSAEWFDYPLSIVLCFVAQGMILRRLGGPISIVSGTLLTSGIAWIGIDNPGDVNHYLFYFILPASGLVHLASRFPDTKLRGLDWLGRHPLTSYLAQYYVIFAVAYWLAVRGK